jgi:tRNA A-37 threonylcarbamoyl transferase component Bud32
MHLQIPDGYEFIQRGAAQIVVHAKYRDCLLEQGIDRPDLLFQKALPDERRGRGSIRVLPLTGRPGERLIIRQCLRGGLVRFINRDVYLRWHRPLQELAVSVQAAAAGLPTAQVLAAVSLRVARGWKGYLFIQELAGYDDVPTYLKFLQQQNPTDFFSAKRAMLRSIAALVTLMHECGFEHGDLNLKNFLININNPNCLALIDWDKSRVHTSLTTTARRKNVLRLCRSVLKFSHAGYPLNLHDAAYLLQTLSSSIGCFRRDFMRLRFTTRLRSTVWRQPLQR